MYFNPKIKIKREHTYFEKFNQNIKFLIRSTLYELTSSIYQKYSNFLNLFFFKFIFICSFINLLVYDFKSRYKYTTFD